MNRAINYEAMHEFVQEHSLTENDTIMLHPHDYDTVATEFIIENNLIMYRPVEVLGTRIVEDTTGEVKRNNVYVMPLAAS
jgi:hypothetical protein